MDSLPTELASTIQAGHVRQHPDPNLDLTPASSALPPATAATSDPEKIKPLWQQSSSLSPVHDLDSIDDDRDIPPSATSIPAPRRQNLPPLPDLRFEQSYLHSIANADTWWKVLLITARDQVMMPLLQGVVYNLLVCGWQSWNRNAQIHGNSVGARLRRWWYQVNDWKIPDRRPAGS